MWRGAGGGGYNQAIVGTSRIRPFLPLALAGLLALPGPGPAAAQDRPRPEGGGLDVDLPEPLTEAQRKEAMKIFEEAKRLLEKNAYSAARKKFHRFLDDYPGMDPELVEEAEDRSGENCLVGIELQHESGPPEKRIDIELMGDGYSLRKFNRFPVDARNQMKEFWKEPLYDEYQNYFNVWRFDLISAEEGVDEMSMEERMGAPEKEPEEDRPGRRNRGPRKYSTALNCKALGGGGQVWADPDMVMKWRKYFPQGDGLTIAFARKGQLGMGGGGIATTGRRVAVVHEFGHAFIGLLDEYANNPGAPMGGFGGGMGMFGRAPNAAPADPDDPRKEPSWDMVPWRHWLELRNSPVGLSLGGATYQIGVFKPTSSCSMNSGSDPYCVVCREAGVLRIYSYINPIEESGPSADIITLVPGEKREFFVQPMQPMKHNLDVEWYLEMLPAGAVTAGPDLAPDYREYGESFVRDERAAGRWKVDGDRAFARRQNPLPEGPPPGEVLKAKTRKAGKRGFQSVPDIPDLAPGAWKLTARVRDGTKVPGSKHPWVIKDTARILEERRTWTLEVRGAPEPAPVPAPETDPPDSPK